MKTLVLVLMILATLSVTAQMRAFRWEDALCKYEGTYNAKKYTPTQLRNTLKLFWPGEFSFLTNATVFTPDDISKLNVDSLDREYEEMTAVLESLNIVNTPYWKDFRQRKLDEIKQIYNLSRVSMLAYKDPISLKTLSGAEACKTKYALPLISGGNDLLAVWRVVNEDLRSKNGDPGRIRRIYDEQHALPDRMKYAFVEVITFGWWNCANESIKYVQYDGTPEKEYRKLFVRVKKLSCDQP